MQDTHTDARPQIRALDIVNRIFALSGLDDDINTAFANLVIADDIDCDNDLLKIKTLARFVTLERTSDSSKMESSQLKHAYPVELTEEDVDQGYDVLTTEFQEYFSDFFAARCQRQAGFEKLLALDLGFLRTDFPGEGNGFFWDELSTNLDCRCFVLCAQPLQQTALAPVGFFVSPLSHENDGHSYNLSVIMEDLGEPDCEVVADCYSDLKLRMSVAKECGLEYTLRVSAREYFVQEALRAHLKDLNVYTEVSQKGAKALAWRDEISVAEQQCYLYLRINPYELYKVMAILDSNLANIVEAIEEGDWDAESASEAMQMLAARFLDIQDDGEGGKTALYKEEEMKLYCASSVVMALVSNVEHSLEDAVKLYSTRKLLQEEYSCLQIDSYVWSEAFRRNNLAGRLFISFVAFSAMFYGSCWVDTLKSYLSQFVEDHQRQKKFKAKCEAYSDLEDWLEDRSFEQILGWFDAEQNCPINEYMAQDRWADACQQRDQLFLAFLGLVPFPQGLEAPDWEDFLE